MVFTARNYGSPRLFYVLPGAVVPPRGTALVETGTRERWLSTPLGGGWYRVD
jgi:hypothetical protein